MARKRRNLQGQKVVNLMIKMRSSTYAKLKSLVAADGTLVETVEQMTEYLYYRRHRRDHQHNLTKKY